MRILFWRGFRAPPLAHSQADRWVAHRGRCAIRYGRPSVAYVTPSRRATRTALSNSSIAPAPAMCHLDVATLRRFSPATAGTPRGEGRGQLPVLAVNW